MFGLSWEQIILILLAGLFLLGPERIPTVLKWILDSLKKVRSFAAGAQSEMRSQLGPELEELRRQVAELQSLKELKELRELRDLDPRRMVGKTLLGEEFSGGVKGFLGLTGDGPDAAAAAGTSPAAPAPAAPAPAPTLGGASQQAAPAPANGSSAAPQVTPAEPRIKPAAPPAAAPPDAGAASWAEADIT